ncbi:hypothetical protein ACFFRR_005928 [Megaselia abdita]
MYSLFGLLLFVQGFVCQINFPSVGQENSCIEGEVCKKFKDCKSAVKAWNNLRKQPNVCYFQGKDQYVCCSNGGSSNSRIIEKPSTSQQKCDDYYPLINFNPGGFKINVVGGVNAAPREFPFMVALRWGEFDGPSSYLCGGMLVSPTFVLTAAHCTSIEGVQPKFARIGGDDLSGTSDRDSKIKAITIHPYYNPESAYDDIALIELEQRTKLTPACLWLNKNPLPKEATAIGYGHKEFAGTNSKILQKVNLSLFNNTNCNKYYNAEDSNVPQGIKKSQICAGELKQKKDTCQGDSGGPLLSKLKVGNRTIPYLIGVTSFGSFCASGVPAVYTRISEYSRWIERVVWRE